MLQASDKGVEISPNGVPCLRAGVDERPSKSDNESQKSGQKAGVGVSHKVGVGGSEDVVEASQELSVSDFKQQLAEKLGLKPDSLPRCAPHPSRLSPHSATDKCTLSTYTHFKGCISFGHMFKVYLEY